MQVTLRCALAGAIFAFLIALAPAAVAQNDVAEPGNGPVMELTHKPVPLPTASFGDLLYDNGPLVNSPGPPQQSVLQSTSLMMTIIGFGTQGNLRNRSADDFTVPAGGWDIDEMVFFNYQTGSTTTSTINGLFIRIFDGEPGQPGTNVVFGDTTTNRFVSSTFSNIYRVTETTLGNTTRPVMASTAAVDVTLDPGTYWVEWGVTGTLASGPWQPAITINGQTNTGNALQYLGTTNAWAPATDVGPQGFPFQIYGTAGGGGGCTPSATVFCSTDTPLAIPDGSVPGVNSVINVAPLGSLIIDDLDIGFDMTHTWVGDVRAQVTFGATTVAFFDRPGVPASTFGCSGDNANVFADDEGTDGSFENNCADDPAPEAFIVGGSYTPNSPLSAFDGVDASGAWTLNVNDQATPDSGTLNSWSLIITPGGGPIVNTYPSTNVPQPIADNATFTSTIVIPQTPNVVVDLDVEFQAAHTFIGDLIVAVEHDATSVTFMDRPGRTTTGFGCGGDNPDIVADDEGTDGSIESSCTSGNPGYPVVGGHYTPNNPLSAFDGHDVDGTWTLTGSDNAGGDTGSLTAWALVITEDVGTASPGEPTSAVASLRASPNPMTGTGTIELTVPTSQAVRVAVYDQLGREVMVLLDRELTAAQRAVIGLNTEALGAGVYVIRATGEDFSTIQRVTIAR